VKVAPQEETAANNASTVASDPESSAN